MRERKEEGWIFKRMSWLWKWADGLLRMRHKPPLSSITGRTLNCQHPKQSCLFLQHELLSCPSSEHGQNMGLIGFSWSDRSCLRLHEWNDPRSSCVTWWEQRGLTNQTCLSFVPALSCASCLGTFCSFNSSSLCCEAETKSWGSHEAKTRAHTQNIGPPVWHRRDQDWKCFFKKPESHYIWEILS